MNLDTKWLGRVPYREAHALQVRLREARRVGTIDDTLLLLEHPPTFTMGRRNCEGDFLVPPATLASRGFDIVKAERGGKITYHGPGQVVGYLICDLRKRRLSVPDFVAAVEKGLAAVLFRQGVEAGRRPGSPGLWVGGKKIASIGFHIDRGISMHGFSLNVCGDLAPFNYIIPCGQECAMTSIAQETGRIMSMDSFTFIFDLHINGALKAGGSESKNPGSRQKIAIEISHT